MERDPNPADVNFVHGPWPEPQVMTIPIPPEMLPVLKSASQPDDNVNLVYEGWEASN